MLIRADALVGADFVSPGAETAYLVAYAPGHKTLMAGDRVVMCETPKFDNVLLRITDNTLHSLQNEDGRYAVLVPVRAVKDSAHGFAG